MKLLPRQTHGFGWILLHGFGWIISSLGFSFNLSAEEFAVVGYLPAYRIENWSKTVGPLTDLIYFGMPAPDDGRFDPTAIPEKHLAILRSFKKQSSCRILFTVGGWKQSAGFNKIVATPLGRRKFIQAARNYCLQNHFDGIDYDWEHPKQRQQVNGFQLLVKETAEQFSPKNLMVTIAQAGWQTFQPEFYKTVDRVHLMAYDHGFPQATIEKTSSDLNRLLRGGCPRKKIILGIPFYGRSKDNTAKPYSELAQISPAQTDSNLIAGFAFNGPQLVRRKVNKADTEKLGGVMAWEIGQDASGFNSLLRTIADELQNQ
ncbi:MAG: glycoside hydrolase family 18 protein [Planctomycetota bacterium]|nr:glycoside hydrolase family 18 protein [Planctomycetota bacterium]